MTADTQTLDLAAPDPYAALREHVSKQIAWLDENRPSIFLPFGTMFDETRLRAVSQLLTERDTLLAAARQGEEDTATLDWLHDQCTLQNIVLTGLEPNSDPGVWSVQLEHGGGCDEFEGYNLRAALDAARAAAQPEEVSRG